MNWQAFARRMDFYLRGKYLDITTTIYQIEADKYLIFCEDLTEDFEKIRSDFNYSILMLGVPVDLINKKPEIFISILDKIEDVDIPKNFEGLPLNLYDLLNILVGKFPEVYFHKIERGDRKIIIRTCSFEEKIGNVVYSRFLSINDREKIEVFLNKLRIPLKFELIEDTVESPPILTPTLENPIQYIYAHGFYRKNALECSKRDEALWYDNLDKIFEGEFKKQDLFFYNDEYSCYVDFSSFDNIDIRNHLFLFQSIYLSLPYDKNIKQWLESKKITEGEFLGLIERGRIKIILTQPELRYDVDFLREVYNVNPNAIITRRAIAALQQIDIVEISDNYIFNDLKTIKEFKTISELFGKAANISANSIYEMMVWPIRARKNSFEGIQRSGLFSVPSFGVNKTVEKTIGAANGKDYSFEFTISASSIHLAHSLNATYFPYITPEGFSDYYFTNVMGELLNFYKNATATKLKNFIESRQEMNSGILPINPIDIIEINDFISITELEKTLSKDTIYPNSKRLIEYLSSLTPEQRKIKINQYNSEVNKKINKRYSLSSTIELGSNVLMDATGAYTNFSALGTALTFLKFTGKSISSTLPFIKNINAKIEDALSNNIDEANIHYLTRINRVAKIKGSNL